MRIRQAGEERRMFRKAIFLLMLACLTTHTFAFESGYFNEHAQGWHWYNDPKQNEDEENDKEDPNVQMNAVRAAVDRAKNKMVLHPTKENVKDYIEIQNRISNNAAKLSQTWRDVLMDNPDLDFSLIHPTNNVAKQVENDLLSKKENAAVQQLAKTSGLFFFYRSSCPYCVRFAPIVKDFAETYGITVIPITTDGVSLPEFPN
jgi:conjugal transfer pilus assembly protein TraF